MPSLVLLLCGNYQKLGDKMPCRVLIVDSNRHMSTFLSALLNRLNYNVQTVDSGNTVLTTLADKVYDCIIVNYVLHDMDGIRLVSAIRQIDEHAGIVMLSEDVTKTEEQCEGLNVWAVVPKPFNTRLFIQNVKDACEFACLSHEKRNEFIESIDSDSVILKLLHDRIMAPRRNTDRIGI